MAHFRDAKEEAESKANMNMYYTDSGHAVYVSKSSDLASEAALLDKWRKNTSVCPRCDSPVIEYSVTDGCRFSGLYNS